MVKDQHYAWTLGAVFNLKKPPLGCERRLLLAVVGKEGGGCLGEVRSSGDGEMGGDE